MTRLEQATLAAATFLAIFGIAIFVRTVDGAYAFLAGLAFGRWVLIRLEAV